LLTSVAGELAVGFSEGGLIATPSIEEGDKVVELEAGFLGEGAARGIEKPVELAGGKIGQLGRILFERVGDIEEQAV
jgi:hypothetical protein